MNYKFLIVAIIVIGILVFIFNIIRSEGTFSRNINGKTSSIHIKDVKYWAYLLKGEYSSGEVKELVNSSYDLIVLEPTRTLKDSRNFNMKRVVDRVKQSKSSKPNKTKLVFAYINIGEAESWRWYFDNIKNHNKDLIIKEDPDGWSGEFLVKFWEQKWKDIILYGVSESSNFTSSIQQAMDDGFDGVYLDWVESYADEDIRKISQKEGIDAKSEMIKFLSEIRSFTKNQNDNFLIIQQNATSIIDENMEAINYIDAIAQEAIWYDGTSFDDWENNLGADILNETELSEYYIENLNNYMVNNIPVFNVEYCEKFSKDAYLLSRKMGYIPYCTKRALSRLTNTKPY